MLNENLAAILGIILGIGDHFSGIYERIRRDWVA